MKCDKCGNPVTETDRICKNCGELNKHNPNNANLMSMMKHSTNARNNAFQSSIDKNTLRSQQPQSEYKNQIRTEGPSAQDFQTNDAPVEQPRLTKVKTGVEMPKSMLIFDAIIAIFLLAPSLLVPKALLANIISVAITMIYLMASQMLIVKAREPWWSTLIPIYNVYVINKILLKNGWMFLIVFVVPILMLLAASAGAIALIPTLALVAGAVSFIYSLCLTYQMGNRYGMNGILMIFFGVILLPFVGLSSRYQYIG